MPEPGEGGYGSTPAAGDFLSCLDDCCMCDPDDLLAYRRPQYVYLQHRVLGFTQLSFTIVVLLYIGIYELWIMRGYATKEVPVGATRISTMRPDWAQLSGTPSEVFPYCCNPTATGCGDLAAPKQTLPCLAWGELQMADLLAEEHSAFIATRVSVTTYTPVDEDCALNVNNACRTKLALRNFTRTNYYTADPESIQLMVQGSIYAPGISDIRQFSGNHRHDDFVSATMKKENGDDFMNFCQEDFGDSENPSLLPGQRRGSTDPDEQGVQCEGGSGRNWLRQQRHGDILSLGQLLETLRIEENSHCASGLDCTNVLGGKGDPYRYDGIQIVLPMIFSQVDNRRLQYYYEPKWLRGQEWEQNYQKREWSKGPQATETFLKYHGVRISIVMVGTVGVFSLIELLKTFVGGMALMALSGFFMERIVMSLPWCWGGTHHIFKRYMYIFSHDFSSIEYEENPEDPDLPFASFPTGPGPKDRRLLDDEMFTRGDTRGRYQGTGAHYKTVCCGIFRAPPDEPRVETKYTWYGAHHEHGWEEPPPETQALTHEQTTEPAM